MTSSDICPLKGWTKTVNASIDRSSPRQQSITIALQLLPTRVIDVSRGKPAKEILNMKKKPIAQETALTTAPATEEQPKAEMKAKRAPRGAHVAAAKGKVGKKATPAKKAPKGAKKATPVAKEKATRSGSKTNKILELLRQPGGVTSSALQKASGWQPHSVRGFLSGTVGKKMGLKVISAKGEDGERNYSIEG
jgi:hypothetical protein